MFGMGGFQLLPFYDAVPSARPHPPPDRRRALRRLRGRRLRPRHRPGRRLRRHPRAGRHQPRHRRWSRALNAGIPLVAIVGDTNRDHSWKNMTQEARQLEILRPAVKEVIRVESPRAHPRAVRRAFAVGHLRPPRPRGARRAGGRRPRRVRVRRRRLLGRPDATLQVPARRTRPDAADVERAAALLAGAERPLILVGGGIHLSGRYAALLALAEAARHPGRAHPQRQGLASPAPTRSRSGSSAATAASPTS